MTRPGLGGVVFCRVVLSAVIAVDLLSYSLFLSEARHEALAHGPEPSRFAEIASRPVVEAALILIGVIAVVSFARRPGRLWQGLLALGALAVLSTAHTQLFGSPWRHLFFSGLCLAGWLLGLIVSRLQADPNDESYARTGATAFLGAAYLSSGISKLVYGGLTWLSGLPVQSSVVGQSGLVGEGIAGAYRTWVVATPAVASVLSTATLGLELAGPLLLAGRKTRLLVALGLIGMHANIYVLSEHILYWESIVLLAVFGFSPDPPADAAPADAPASLPSNLAFVAGITGLAAAALLAIGHQARRNARTIEPTVVQDLAPPTPDPTIAQYGRIGPFTVGQSLAGNWQIDLLEARQNGFMVRVKSDLGQSRFDLTCATEGSGPFDVGDAHIFYSRDLELGQIEAVGKALQTEVRQATGGRDVCQQLRGWQAAAQAGKGG